MNGKVQCVAVGVTCRSSLSLLLVVLSLVDVKQRLLGRAAVDALGLSDQLALFVNSLSLPSLYFSSSRLTLVICSTRMFGFSVALWRTLYTLVSGCGLCLGLWCCFISFC